MHKGETTHDALVHERLDDVREERGDIRVPQLLLVRGDLESHARLDVHQLPVELGLLRVLPKPSSQDCQRRVQHMKGEAYAGKDMGFCPP